MHELDASMIVFYLNLRPNMIVCESGTGSGALSHCLMRTVAPHGKLYTYEFNGMRAETARQEFAKNRAGHLVEVTHKDVCGKHGPGGFDRPPASVDAVILDLPEPWTAVAHCAHVLKPNARLASYSPCVEQSQRTIEQLMKCGFHSIKTMEFRLKEYHVDEAEFDPPPREKRPRQPTSAWPPGTSSTAKAAKPPAADTPTEKPGVKTEAEEMKPTITKEETPRRRSADEDNAIAGSNKRKKLLVTRPFATMRGHTAFLTFCTAGNKPQPDPNQTAE